MVKLFAPATGAAVVLLAPLVATAGGVVEDNGGVACARTDPALRVPRRRVAEKILFI
jgi:hypothetical protein